MPWTTPHTFVDGEMTSALLNANLRDNVNYLFDVPCFRVHFASVQYVPNNVYTGIAFNFPADGADLTTFLQDTTMTEFFPGRITIDRGGVWHFDVTIDINDEIGQSLVIYLRDYTNDKYIAVGGVQQLESQPDGCSGQLSVDALIEEGTVLEVGVVPTNLSSSVQIRTGDSWTPLWCGYWVRDAPE